MQNIEDLRLFLDEHIKKLDIEEAIKAHLEKIIDEVISRREWFGIEPELYSRLMEETSNLIITTTSDIRSTLNEIRDVVKQKMDIKAVKIEERFKDSSIVASDSSSHPLPLAMARMALVGGIAIRLPDLKNPSITAKVVKEDPTIHPTEFRYLVAADREAIVPQAISHQIKNYGPSEYALLDGPLSMSQWWRERWSEKVKKKVAELVETKKVLAEICKNENVILMAVVKRSHSTYFHNYLELEDNLTDQFLFNNLLNYGERTASISISEAIRKWRGDGRDLVINQLGFEVYGFYIKTSRNPLTPPVRVEYPEYLRKYEDEIASYVLSTAVQSYEKEFDGLPKAQSVAHTTTKITGKVMREILKSQIWRVADRGLDIRLMAMLERFQID